MCPATAIPTASWGTATASWAGDVLSLFNGAKPTFTATASVGDFAADNRWQDCHYRLQASGFTSSTLNAWQGAKTGASIVATTGSGIPTAISGVYNPLGTGTPSTVKVEAWQVYFVDSDSGPLAFVREIHGLSVVIP